MLLGRWLDAHYKVASVSWTLNFLLLGFLVGVFSAWQWLKREGIDRAQKEQNRRNALVDQAQASSMESGEKRPDFTEDDSAGEKEEEEKE